MVGGGGEDFALMAPRAKPTAFAGEGQKIFVGTVITADAGEAAFERAAVEEFAEDFGDDGAEWAIEGLVVLGIGRDKCVVVPLGALPKGRIARVA